jgi:hypothetical protein
MAHCPVISWKPLGELLVERDLLTVAELDDALEEQARTGERLGKILVARKAVPGVVLTTLLAEQVGLELETQSGFGSGLFSKIAERHGSPAPESSRPLPAAATAKGDGSEPPIAAGALDPAYELSALRTELELLRARNAELEAELAELKTKPASRRRASSKSSKTAA